MGGLDARQDQSERLDRRLVGDLVDRHAEAQDLRDLGGARAELERGRRAVLDRELVPLLERTARPGRMTLAAALADGRRILWDCRAIVARLFGPALRAAFLVASGV